MKEFKSRPAGDAVVRFASELRRVRTARGMSQLALAKKIKYSETQVYRIEGRQRWPKAEFARRCDQVLDAGGVLTGLWPAVETARINMMRAVNPDADQSTNEPSPRAATDRHYQATSAASHDLRVRLHECAASMDTDPAGVVGTIDQVRHLIDGMLDDGSPGTCRLQRLEARTDDHAREALTAPPREMLCRLAHTLIDAQHLDQVAGVRVDRVRLRRVIARLAILTADELSVLGDVPGADGWYGTAFAAATASDDQTLRADVRTFAAMLPLHHGRPGQAARLARQGRDMAGGRPCLAAALAPMLESLALARCGQPDQARQVLDEARRGYDRADETVQAESVFGFSPRRRLFYEGRVLTAIGDYGPAWQAHRQALALYPCEVVGDPTLIHLDQAAGLVGRGQVVDGVELVTATMISLPPPHRGGLFLRAARAVLDLVPHIAAHLPAVRACGMVLTDLERSEGRDAADVGASAGMG